MSNPPLFLEWLEDLQHELERWDAVYEDGDAVAPDDAPRQRHHLQWLPGDVAQASQLALPLDEVRDEMLRVMTQATAESSVLLVRAKPGTGKTHAAVRLAQEQAALGRRVLFLMPTHRHYSTLEGLPHHDPALWYHWHATHHEQDDGSPFCRYHNQAAVWTAKGYSLHGMCRTLCPRYRSRCPYRLQAKQQQPIIAGVHEHLVVGLAIDRFDLVIVDELPLRAFLAPRSFSARDIAAVAGNAGGPFAPVLRALLDLAVSDEGLSDAGLSGRAVFDTLGPPLGEAYSSAMYLLEQLRAGVSIDEPFLESPDDVEKAPPSLLPPLLRFAVPEFIAWKNGMQEWLPRVTVAAGRLQIDGRGDAWSKLGQSAIVLLDATGRADIYQELLGREVTDYEPPAALRGRVFQVVNRLNGKRQLEDEKLDYIADTHRMLAQLIARHNYRCPGLVSFKGLLAHFEDLFGASMSHFYGQRGSNDLEHVDSLFVLGSPSPPGYQVLRTAAMLYSRRMTPFSLAKTEDGVERPMYSERLRPYRFNQAGLVPHRMIRGFWDDWHGQLETLHGMFREDELLQAVHRARPLTRAVDVWLFSSIPTSLPLAGIYDDWAAALGSPEIPCPPGCGAYCRHKNADGTQRRIKWEYWVKISEWLFSLEGQTTIDAGLLAEVSGTSREYVSHERWLPAIANAWPDHCDIRSLTYRPGRKLSVRWSSLTNSPTVN